MLALQLTPLRQTSASDHIDSPQLAQDHGSDINDMYFFLDPNDNSRVVMVMTISPFLISSEIIGQAIFDHNIRYRFEIENTGDAQPDRFLDVRFTRGLGRETGPQTAYITLPNGRTFTAPTNVATQGADVPDINPPALDKLAGREEDAKKQYELVEQIGHLSDLNGALYNRQLALFYADHDTKAEEAYRLAAKEYEARRDIYGADGVQSRKIN